MQLSTALVLMAALATTTPPVEEEPVGALPPVLKADGGLDSGRPLDGFRQGAEYQGIFMSAKFSPDGSVIVATSSNSRIFGWKTETGRLSFMTQDYNRRESPALDATIDPQNRWIITGGPWMHVRLQRGRAWAGGVIRFWDLDFPQEEAFRFVSTAVISTISVSKDARRVSMIDWQDRFLVLEDIDIEQRIRLEPTLVLEPPMEKSRYSSLRKIGRTVGISEDGLRAVSTFDRGLLLYDANKKEVRRITQTELIAATGVPVTGTAEPGVVGAMISPDGTLVALRFSKPTNIYLLKHETLEPVREIALDQSEEASLFEFDSTGHRLAVGTRDGRLSVFELDQGQRIATHEGHNADPIQALRFVGDELFVLSGAGEHAQNLPPDIPEEADPSRLYLWRVKCPEPAEQKEIIQP